MGFFNAIGNSIKSFSKNCFEEIKNRSIKYNKTLSNLKIDISKVSNINVSMRKYFADEMSLAMQDKKGYFLKMDSMMRETGENIYYNAAYGMNVEQYKQNKEQETEAKKNAQGLRRSDNNYDIGE